MFLHCNNVLRSVHLKIETREQYTKHGFFFFFKSNIQLTYYSLQKTNWILNKLRPRIKAALKGRII